MWKEYPNNPNSHIEVKTSIKDFPNVLNKVLLNTPYAISALEFEFALEWNILKPLLDRSCEYKIEADKILILSKTPKLREEKKDIKEIPHEQKLQILSGIFFNKRGYRSVKLKHFKPTPEQIRVIEWALKRGVVIRFLDTLMLHKYLRKINEHIT